MKYFKNIREAHYYYKFPGSYRIGCIIKDDIVIRVYSNNKSKPDFFNKNNREFFYTLKNSKIKLAFENNKKLKKTIHVFSRSNDKVIDYGLYLVKGFRKDGKYVLLVKK